MYYQVLKNYLEQARYAQDGAQERIDYAVARGRISADEAAELTQLAASKASEPPLFGQVELLARRLEAYRGLVAWSDLEAGSTVEEGTTVLFAGTLYRSVATHEKQADRVPGENSEYWEMLG